MTTVAWDGKTIAADRQATGGGGLRRELAKLYRSRLYIFGGVGQLDDVMSIAEWFRLHDANSEKAPTLSEGGTNGIAVDTRSGKAFIVEGAKPRLSPILESFHASGSGRDFAISAMAFGKNAREAVLFASRFDVFTGGKVDVVHLERKGHHG